MRELPPGIYERLIDRALAARLAALERQGEVKRQPVDPAELPGVLARWVDGIARRAFEAVDPGPGAGAREERLREARLALARRILEAILECGRDCGLEEGSLLVTPLEELLAVAPPSRAPGAPPAFLPRPATPLSSNALLVNARDEPRLGHEIRREIESADRVDLLCSFLKWSGFRLVRAPLEGLLGRGGALRVLTTTYLGVTEPRALDALLELGAQVRFTPETSHTRLHAKAWIFERESGFSTAYVGSSNLSRSALLDGLEWNVRLSSVESPAVLEMFRETFESYWQSPDFEPYDGEPGRERFRIAARRERDRQVGDSSPIAGLEVRPWPFQEEVLDRLEVEREIHGRRRNLVVAATGTGKTIIAALDYKRLREKWRDDRRRRAARLLFVAHRREILQQSLRAFREVLGEGSFGELLAEGRRPREGSHLFASVQSLAGIDLSTVDSRVYDVVIIDEFHHATAPTYRRLIEHFEPEVLLGLTATPERTDGKRLQDEFFEGRIAAELRLGDAIERGLLVPFHYFAAHDGVDLSGLRWRRGRYALEDLERVYTADDARVRIVLREIADKVTDPRRMRALGFCVSVEHARFMARKFTREGLEARAVTGGTSGEERKQALQQLEAGEIRAIFSVDVFNEGVDIPPVDTLLLLRPTESALLFLQQLGRGLRRAGGKECLTVLDFIGKAHRRFSFASRFRALLGGRGRSIAREIEEEFPVLPPGCSIELERVARDIVLENVKSALRESRSFLVADLRGQRPDISLSRWLEEAGLRLEDVYRKAGDTWLALRRDAGLARERPPPKGALDAGAWRAVARLRHADDPGLLDCWLEMLDRFDEEGAAALAAAGEDRRVDQLAAVLLFAKRGLADRRVLAALLERQPLLVGELRELFGALRERIEHPSRPFELCPEVPLRIHCRYSLDQIRAAFAIEASLRRGGVHHDEGTGCDLLFVTIEKSEKDYSPATMYRDHALSSELFHWESQNTTTPGSPTARRYLAARGERRGAALLFVRKERREEGGLTAPYVFLGPAAPVAHEGSRPISITWKLDAALPPRVWRETRLATG